MQNKPTYARDELTIRFLGFASKGKAILYSGVVWGVTNNWEKAAKHAKKQNMIPVELTEGGLYLSTPDRFKIADYGGDLAEKIWMSASRKYCNNIYGDLKTFVCCARPRSIFRLAELRQIVRNKKVDTINGRPREEFYDFRMAYFKRVTSQGVSKDKAILRSLDAVYRKIVIQEIREDLNIAKAEKNFALIHDCTLRVRELRALTRIEFAMRANPSAKYNRMGELDFINEMNAANPNLMAEIVKHLGARHGHSAPSLGL